MAWLLSFVAIAYAGFLFWFAWKVEQTPRGSHWVDRPAAYALAIGVYCTSWTFFGAVGSAATGGWSYLPIYLGPALLFLFGHGFLRRLAEAVQRESLTSIADYISSRFGKSRSLAALVTLLATCAALPYIALQLKSLGMSASALMVPDVIAAPAPSYLMVALIAAALAAFSMVFGAQRYEATGRNRGLVAAIAVEAIVKLSALLLVGAYAIYLLVKIEAEGPLSGVVLAPSPFALDTITPTFLTTTLLSIGAIVCLPRQFYIGFVEYRGARDLRAARRLVPAYMALTAIVIVPITLAGLSLLPKAASPDLYVLDLPLAHDADWLALLAFLGGFSAATGMVIVECVALSTMISNDLVAPFLLRGAATSTEQDLGKRLLLSRRISIVAILALSFGFYLGIDRDETLANIGLVAFAAVAQFAPALIASLYWPQASQRGVRWGLCIGGTIWGYTLVLPTLLGMGTIEDLGLTHIAWGALNPRCLFHLGNLDPLTHGAVWSLGLNVLALIGFSRFSSAPIADRLRAAVFSPGIAVGGKGAASNAGDLLALAERFVGATHAKAAFEARFPAMPANAPITAENAGLAERLVAQVIGAPSARVILRSALRSGSVDVADVVSLIDETKQELHFSRELLASTLDSISQGVSVVDRDLHLIAWNSRYLELFDFPAGLIRVGRPIADIIRYNAERGECGPGEVDAHVERRLAAIKRRVSHTYERVRPNGTVLKSIGNPMPGGGYVTSFTDITQEKLAQEELRLANENLESRVAARTAELQAANTDLAVAKGIAEAATIGKTKFLAAASHDLLQPLNAARLFSAALDEAVTDAHPQAQALARSINRAIGAADTLLRALLDVSKLEAGGVVAKIEDFALDPLLQDLTAQFAPLAAAKGLRLRCFKSTVWVRSDRSLLRSALQNFIANAIRYTEKGGVLIGCRLSTDRVAIEVWDSGPGIEEAHRRAIFEEFRRFNSSNDDSSAAGLGLAIVERIASLLDARLDLRSRVGIGSVFSIDALRAAVPDSAATGSLRAPSFSKDLPLRVLCVDNDPAILQGLSALLSGWGATSVCVATFVMAREAIEASSFDIALIDFQLGDEQYDGLDLIDIWRRQFGGKPVVMITASASDSLSRHVAELGGVLLRKPIDTSGLRAILETTPHKSGG
jgi:Na+/proline symporter/signal transduction histidine kinase